MFEQHIVVDSAEIDYIEGRGALNFLDIDDVPIAEEGQVVDPTSLVALECKVDLPLIPETADPSFKAFVNQVNISRKKWVILTDPAGLPRLILDADAYLRDVLDDYEDMDAYLYCHRPIIIDDPERPLGFVMADFRAGMADSSDEAIAKDVVLLWTDNNKRVVTGADLLGRLLQGIR